jgi:cell division protein FtsQ
VSRPPRVVSAAPKLAAKAEASRRDRRRTWLRRLGWSSAGVVPLALLGWVLLFSSLFSVQKVLVTGESRLSAAQIEQAASFTQGTALARVDTAGVARRIEQLRQVDHVTVTRSWPDALKVTVVERVPLVAVPRGGSLLLLDAHGVELESVAKAPKGVYRLEVSRPGVDDPATRAALGVLQRLPEPLLGRLGSLRAPSAEQVTLVLRDGRQVLWGGVDNGSAKAAAVLALIRMPGRIYDVSAPGVVTRR